MKMNEIEIALTAGLGAIQKILTDKSLTTYDEITNETNEIVMSLMNKIEEEDLERKQQID